MADLLHVELFALVLMVAGVLIICVSPARLQRPPVVDPGDVCAPPVARSCPASRNKA